jgi:hypothetical protein
VDKDYIVVFDKKLAKTYDAKTTTIMAMAEPVLEASWCTLTGLWLMPLKTKTNGGNQNGNIVGDRASNIEGVTVWTNAIFELPSTRQTILYHHALAGFPIKETFLNAVRTGNYATWPGLTIMALHKYFPDSDEMQKGHMKGQGQGIRSTKQKTLDHLVESEKLVKIKVEPRHGGGLTSKMPQQHIRPRQGLGQEHPLQPNRRVSLHLAARQLLRHDRDPSGCKLHFLWANEEQIGGWDDQGGPINNKQDESGRLWAKYPPTGQQGIKSIQAMHTPKRHDARTSPARQSQKQSGRAGNSNVQTPFYINPEWCGWLIPTVTMVHAPWANGTHHESPQAIICRA